MMNEPKKENFFARMYKKDITKSILASLISIAAGLIVGLIVMIVISCIYEGTTIGDAFSGILIVLKGPFASNKGSTIVTNIGQVIFYAVPLILCGLSVAIAYKTGLFNIGAPGQYVMGTIGSLWVALSIQTTNRFTAVLVWILAILVGMAFGMVWGMIPGFLKAYFNINEVIVCIMTNWIAANLATWVFTGSKLISTENTKGAYLMKDLLNYTPKLGLDKIFNGSYIDMGIILAILAAVVIYILLNKTTLGYELKACGSNKNASKYAGLNEKRNIILSMAIAGALAGLAACLYYLNPGIEFKYASAYSALPSYGFNGIASAFLANCNPIGTVFASIFIRWINMGGEYLTKVNFNRYVADIVVAVIIYLAGFTRFIYELLNRKKKGKNGVVTNVVDQRWNENKHPDRAPQEVKLEEPKTEEKKEA